MAAGGVATACLDSLKANCIDRYPKPLIAFVGDKIFKISSLFVVVHASCFEILRELVQIYKKKQRLEEFVYLTSKHYFRNSQRERKV